MGTTCTSSSITTKQETLNSVDYVAKTPSECLRPVEEFIGKLEEAVRAKL